MFKIKKEYLILVSLFLILGFFHLYKNPIKEIQEHADNLTVTDQPVPIEIVQKKKDRKQFKKSRKEYIDMIHKTEPDLDWVKMDSDFRKERAYQNTLLRKEYINQNGYWDSENKGIFLNRDIEGTWQERGSNNLAGRVHTVDLDFENAAT